MPSVKPGTFPLPDFWPIHHILSRETPEPGAEMVLLRECRNPRKPPSTSLANSASGPMLGFTSSGGGVSFQLEDEDENAEANENQAPSASNTAGPSNSLLKARPPSAGRDKNALHRENTMSDRSALTMSQDGQQLAAALHQAEGTI